MGLIRSCAPLFAPPPPSLFLVSTLLSAPLARARPLLLHKINEKKNIVRSKFFPTFLTFDKILFHLFPQTPRDFLKISRNSLLV